MYTLEAASALLGVSQERIQNLIDQELIEVEVMDGNVMIPEKEVKILFSGNISEDSSSTDTSVEKEPVLEEAMQDCVDDAKASDDVIVVDQKDLVELYGEMTKHADRVNYLIQRGRRIEQKIKSNKRQAMGHDAEFRDLSVAYYPALSGKEFEPETLDDGSLVIRTYGQSSSSTSTKDFNRRMNKLLSEGLKNGHIPPGAMLGPLRPPPGMMDDEDEE